VYAARRGSGDARVIPGETQADVLAANDERVSLRDLTLMATYTRRLLMGIAARP
jgi:hypothetical protein